MYHDYIDVDPAVNQGKPSIRGRRITVETIAEELAAGLQAGRLREAIIEQLMNSYHLTRPEVEDAIAYAEDSSPEPTSAYTPSSGGERPAD
jgi:uncharacterized protein (DUF433 family)